MLEKQNESVPVLCLDYAPGWEYSEVEQCYVNDQENLICQGPVFQFKDLERVLAFEQLEFDSTFIQGQLENLTKLSQNKKIEGLPRQSKPNPLKTAKIKQFMITDNEFECKIEDPVNILSELIQKHFRCNVLMVEQLDQRNEKGSRYIVKFADYFIGVYEVEGKDKKKNKKKVALYIISLLAPNIFKDLKNQAQDFSDIKESYEDPTLSDSSSDDEPIDVDSLPIIHKTISHPLSSFLPQTNIKCKEEFRTKQMNDIREEKKQIETEPLYEICEDSAYESENLKSSPGSHSSNSSHSKEEQKQQPKSGSVPNSNVDVLEVYNKFKQQKEQKELEDKNESSHLNSEGNDSQNIFAQSIPLMEVVVESSSNIESSASSSSENRTIVISVFCDSDLGEGEGFNFSHGLVIKDVSEMSN